jgi:hypothetical protein
MYNSTGESYDHITATVSHEDVISSSESDKSGDFESKSLKNTEIDSNPLDCKSLENTEINSNPSNSAGIHSNGDGWKEYDSEESENENFALANHDDNSHNDSDDSEYDIENHMEAVSDENMSPLTVMNQYNQENIGLNDNIDHENIHGCIEDDIDDVYLNRSNKSENSNPYEDDIDNGSIDDDIDHDVNYLDRNIDKSNGSNPYDNDDNDSNQYEKDDNDSLCEDDNDCEDGNYGNLSEITSINQFNRHSNHSSDSLTLNNEIDEDIDRMIARGKIMLICIHIYMYIWILNNEIDEDIDRMIALGKLYVKLYCAF